jgi:two-component system response regulator RpaA
MARILVIEDDEEVGFLVRISLESNGYDVVTVNDGSRGFAAAQRQNPDLIVLDLMMPIMDGFAVLEALQTNDRTAGVPVLILSAMATEHAQEQCYQRGAKVFMTKPFDPSLLAGVVGEVLGGV